MNQDGIHEHTEVPEAIHEVIQILDVIGNIARLGILRFQMRFEHGAHPDQHFGHTFVIMISAGPLPSPFLHQKYTM